ncbi:MAG: hypothetical protein ABW049_00925 [Spongiibacteraceae bacterium]
MLSALVFPGCGHAFLKRYAMAFLLASISLVSLYVTLMAATELAQGIVDQIQSGAIPLDIAEITAAVSRADNADPGRPAALASYLIVICWIVGIVDSYRIGQRQEKI